MEVVAAEIAVSEHDRAFLARHFPRGAGQLRRLYHSRLNSDSLPASVSREKMVLAVGHLAYRKGQQILAAAFLEIANEFPDWKLLILGHDSGDGCREEIEGLVKRHSAGERVELAGSHPSPMEVMARASVFVQPSLEEALGLAAQEAILAGCPAIGTDAGGIPEVIDDGKTGLIVPRGDVPAMAAALRRMMADEALRKSMSSQGPASILAKGMSREGMIDAHRRLYSEILGKRQSMATVPPINQS
jgi:glycosyltransferase involved in cell wall biosynthesis